MTMGVNADTGIAGLTLGGGFGKLGRKHGLSCDNLISAEIVTAEGRLLQVSATEHADLFWAIRGGGGNFGIAASLEYNLHQVGPMITGGLVAHPLARAKDVLRMYREQCASAPDELMLVAGLLTAPDGSGAKLNGILAAHCGSPADGEAAVRTVKSFGPPVMDMMGPIPYSTQNSLLDGAFPKGALNYWKAQFVTDLTDDCIATLIERFEKCSSPMSQIVIEHFHGAASRVPVDATACAMRITGFNVVIVSQWMNPAENDTHISWARDTYAALAPYLAERRYVNYLGDDEPGDPVAAAYGSNYARLRDLKTKYDPDNLFKENVNIRPR